MISSIITEDGTTLLMWEKFSKALSKKSARLGGPLRRSLPLKVSFADTQGYNSVAAAFLYQNPSMPPHTIYTHGLAAALESFKNALA